MATRRVVPQLIQIVAAGICVFLFVYVFPHHYSAAFDLQYNVYALASALAILSNLLLLLVIYRAQSKTVDTVSFCIFLFCIIFWAICEMMQRLCATPEGALFWNSLAPIAWITVALPFFVFAALFSHFEIVLKYSRNIVGLAFTTLLLLFVTFSTNTIVGHDPSQAIMTAWGWSIPNGPYFWIALVWIESLFCSALVVLMHRYRGSQHLVQRRQALLMIVGVLIPLIGGTITDGILPILNINVLPTAVLLTSIMALVVAYAVLRYNLFSFNVASVSFHILEAMNEIVMVLDDTYHIEYVNKRAEELLQVAPQGLLGLTFDSIFPSKDTYTFVRQHLMEPLKAHRLIETKNSEIIATDKRIIPVIISASRIKSEAGENPGYVVVMTDTARIQAIERQNKLLEQAQHSLMIAAAKIKREKINVEHEKAQDEALLSSIGEGMIATDTTGRIQLMNNQAKLMLGWTSTHNPIGKRFDEVARMVDEQGHVIPVKARPFSIARKTNKQVTLNDYYYVRRDNTRFAVAATASPVILKNKVIGIILIFRDITTEKQIDRAKSEFVSLASHQLRTPLATVKWYVELFNKKDRSTLTPKKIRYMNEIGFANQRMIDLINALLNVSRIELGSFAIKPVELNVKTLIETALADLASAINAKKLQFSARYQLNLPMITCDPNLIRIVVQNIVSNAIKYTPDNGKIVMTVSIIREKTSSSSKTVRNTILIKVSDTGYGIPRDQQGKLFTKLFRADNVSKKDTRGTGLGLYITKSILDAIGGSIWFESKESKGTTFFVAIPSATKVVREGLVLEPVNVRTDTHGINV